MHLNWRVDLYRNSKECTSTYKVTISGMRTHNTKYKTLQSNGLLIFKKKSGSIMTNKLQINAKSVAHTRIERVETTERKNELWMLLVLEGANLNGYVCNGVSGNFGRFVCFCIIGLESKSVLMSSFWPVTDDYAIHIFFQIRRKVSRSLCSMRRTKKKEEKKTNNADSCNGKQRANWRQCKGNESSWNADMCSGIYGTIEQYEGHLKKVYDRKIETSNIDTEKQQQQQQQH